jgi:hypothetical protein
MNETCRAKFDRVLRIWGAKSTDFDAVDRQDKFLTFQQIGNTIMSQVLPSTRVTDIDGESGVSEYKLPADYVAFSTIKLNGSDQQITAGE